MKATGKGPGLLRLNNERRVLSALRQQRITTRQDIARALAVSKNTVSLIVDELISTGLVVEQGTVAVSGAGRPKINITLQPEKRKSAGILVERQQIHLVVCDYFLTPIETHRWQSRTDNPDELLSELVSCCRQLLQRHPELIGIGLGFPGIIDPSRGWLHFSSHLGWQNVDLLAPFSASALPAIRVMNSVKAAALLSLTHYDAGPGESCFYLRIGEGIGGALIQGREVVIGSSWTAGEAGHLTVQPDGPRCSCGRQGCLEALINAPAIDRHLNALQPGLSWQTREQSPVIVAEVMAQAGTWLGAALSQIMLLLNPARLVIDSPWNIHADFVQAARDAAAASTLSFTFRHTQIQFSPLRFDPAHGLALALIEQSEQVTL